MTPTATTPGRTGLAPVNGLELYYEVHGDGEPLVLIHGGLGSVEMFAPVLPAFSAGRRVIAVDLRGHGRTADLEGPFSFEGFADDVAALVRHLGLERADVLGYSLGGGAALQTAIRHPDLVRRLVVVSAPFGRDGWYPDVLRGMAGVTAAAAESMKPSPIYQLYARVAPRPEDFPSLCDKTGRLLGQDYDWSEQVRALPMPALLAFADADSIGPAHAARFFSLLGGGDHDPGWDGSAGRTSSRLAILPGATHYDVLGHPALAPAVLSFLDAPAPGLSPAGGRYTRRRCGTSLNGCGASSPRARSR
jgi:pimeloyl-ACP methyl ester carboxylesterase